MLILITLLLSQEVTSKGVVRMRKPHGIQARTVCWKQRVKLGSSVCHIVSISHNSPPQKSSNVISKEQRKSGFSRPSSRLNFYPP